jgi:hypothetical protein
MRNYHKLGKCWSVEDGFVLRFPIYYLELGSVLPEIDGCTKNNVQRDLAKRICGSVGRMPWKPVLDSFNMSTVKPIAFIVLANRRFKPLPPSMNTLLMLYPLICASRTRPA